MIYLVKPNTWFESYTIADLLEDYRGMDAGLFRGWHRDPDTKERVYCKEPCDFEEFWEITEADWKYEVHPHLMQISAELAIEAGWKLFDIKHPIEPNGEETYEIEYNGETFCVPSMIYTFILGSEKDYETGYLPFSEKIL